MWQRSELKILWKFLRIPYHVLQNIIIVFLPLSRCIWMISWENWIKKSFETHITAIFLLDCYMYDVISIFKHFLRKLRASKWRERFCDLSYNNFWQICIWYIWHLSALSSYQTLWCDFNLRTFSHSQRADREVLWFLSHETFTMLEFTQPPTRMKIRRFHDTFQLLWRGLKQYPEGKTMQASHFEI